MSDRIATYGETMEINFNVPGAMQTKGQEVGYSNGGCTLGL